MRTSSGEQTIEGSDILVAAGRSPHPQESEMYKSGFDPSVSVRLRHSSNGGNYRRGGFAFVNDRFATATGGGP